jgi:hypothetical protein
VAGQARDWPAWLSNGGSSLVGRMWGSGPGFRFQPPEYYRVMALAAKHGGSMPTPLSRGWMLGLRNRRIFLFQRLLVLLEWFLRASNPFTPTRNLNVIMRRAIWWLDLRLLKQQRVDANQPLNRVLTFRCVLAVLCTYSVPFCARKGP